MTVYVKYLSTCRWRWALHDSAPVASRAAGIAPFGVICGTTAAMSGAAAELHTWEKHVLSARGFKRVGRHLEYAI
jgi:hypothetical protein